MHSVLALDIGGSGMKYAVIDNSRNMLDQGKVKLSRVDQEQFLDEIQRVYEQFKDKIDAIGVSMGGKMDPSSGIVMSSGQYPFTQYKNIKEMISERCDKIKVYADNDAHCAAYAEMKSGCLTDVKNAIVVVMGTGIGGAIIINRNIYDGSRFCAAEFSLLRVSPDPDLKNSWNFHGGSAVGLVEEVKRELHTNEEIDGVQIFRMLKEGNEAIKRAFETYCRICAVQLYNLQSIFDVEVIAIGGGISAQQILIDTIRKYLQEIFDAEAECGLAPAMPKLVGCKYHNNANLYGAWQIANGRIDN